MPPGRGIGSRNRLETRKLPETTVTAGVQGGKNDCSLSIGEAPDRLEGRLLDRQGLRNVGGLSSYALGCWFYAMGRRLSMDRPTVT